VVSGANTASKSLNIVIIHNVLPFYAEHDKTLSLYYYVLGK
jgi:hypothetical protein